MAAWAPQQASGRFHIFCGVVTGICLHAACSGHEIMREWKRPGQAAAWPAAAAANEAITGRMRQRWQRLWATSQVEAGLASGQVIDLGN
eukprot:COSAG01_NODE_7611_length_3127_cov_51.853038_2_plen_89_part_00